MSNSFININYTTSGTYTLNIDKSDLYTITLVGGGGNAYYKTTGDADGGYAYTRGWGGGSGAVFRGTFSLTAGNYTVTVGGVAGTSSISDPFGNEIVSVGGGTNAGSWAVGNGGAVATINSNYVARDININKAGNNGLTAKGDWGKGYGTGGASLWTGYGTGQSINADGSWGRTDGYFNIITYTLPDTTEKLYAFQKDVFDINKVTVVGNPTITSDGVASGLSGSNLIYKDVDLANKSFVIETPVYHYSQTSSADQYIISVGTYNNKLFLQARILVSGKISIGIQNDTTPIVTDANTNAVLGNTYQIKFVLNTTKAEIYLKTNNNNYELVKSAVNNSLYTLNNNRLYIGNAYVGASQPFLGSIDLTQFKIYVDNQLVFQPVKPAYLLERRKEGYDPSKFTVVGSPTITSNGVASGFSGSDYITTPKIVNITNTSVLKLAGRFKTSTLASRQILINVSNAMGSDLSTSKITLRFETNGTSSGFITNADGIQVANLSSSNIKLQANTEYDFSFKLDGLFYEFKVGDSTLSGTLSNYLLEGLYMVSVGKQMYISHSYWLGLIDLSQFSITVDGKEVFTGAKEVYYAMEK